MNTPTLHLIYARARNGVIGRQGALPWHLPEDLAHFKRCTLGHPVIMGRKTWDSLPARFRPLPGRPNVVVTRQTDWHAPGALPAHDLHQALALCGSAPQAWIIGGAQIYTQAMPMADELVVTEIDADFEGDATVPAPDASWMEVERQPHVGAEGLPFAFVRYRRRPRTG